METTVPTPVNTFRALASGVASSTCETMVTVSATPSFPPAVRITIEDAEERLRRVFDRFPLLEQATLAMQRLGLSTPVQGRRTPLQLLSDAQAVLEKPSVEGGGPASMLIPLRGCLEGAIAELLRRRQTQEPAPRTPNKLASLQRHCGRPDLPEGHLGRMATDVESVLNDLSATKQADMARERQTELFHRGVLILNALLDSIDETRLRPT